jgi:two-component system NtrC family sensor kinase
MGAALGLGAAGILLGAGAWNLHLQRRHLTGLLSASADRIAETIRLSTREAMLRDDRDSLHRMIATIRAQPGIARIRVFNKEGRIRSSTEADEVGTVVDVRAEECTACHQSDRPLERLERPDRVRLFRDAAGQRVLGIIAPIHNEPPCTACHAHPASQRLLGVLDVQLSLASVDEAVAQSELQMLSSLAVTVGAVLALAGLLAWRMVLRPLGAFSGAIARACAGDLDTPVALRSSDEFGALASSWNAMTETLGAARQQLEALNETLEQRVREKTAELERAHGRMLVVEKLASLGKLAAVVAHEVNNPLAGIRTYARVLRRKAAAAAERDAETERILEMVDAEAGRCGEIVRNLLVFGRSSGGRMTEEELGPVLERCRALLQHQADLLGIALEVTCAGGLPRITCDASQLEQMVLALAMNALEATPAGGRVAIAARGAADGGVVVTVQDTGGGIADENLPRIFEPFFTTKEAGKGVGLGLAVVYGIVTRHGGRVEVDSRVGAGTRFEVSLPRHPPQESAAAGPAGAADEQPVDGKKVAEPSPGAASPSRSVGGTVWGVDEETT